MSDQPQTAPAPAVNTDVELRVLIRGLKLDDNTQKLIEAAIRSAVLQELAVVDHGGARRIASPGDDPQTRSLLSSLSGKILGLIVSPT